MGAMDNARSWLVVGGGIHGVHVAARLIARGVNPERVRILDPADELLERWRTCTATTGMTHLRSPSVHHLDVNPLSLRLFAEERSSAVQESFAPPYDRPSLDLFNAHCERVIESYGLGALQIRNKAAACHVDRDGVTVRTPDGDELRSTHVVLAIGTGDQPEWPDWAPPNDARVAHIFARGFTLPFESSERRVAMVGGGISATQTALRLAAEGHHVHLISRHALREHHFDSDPGWLGPKFMTGFWGEERLDRRRNLINRARHRGSVLPGIRHALDRAVTSGAVSWHNTAVNSVEATPEHLHLRLSNESDVRVERILLATGFSSKRPGGEMLDQMIDAASLPCSKCGYPVVDSALRWHPRVHVTGPLAELELGPTSRNIAGARQAGDKIVSTLTRRAHTSPGGFRVGTMSRPLAS